MATGQPPFVEVSVILLAKCSTPQATQHYSGTKNAKLFALIAEFAISRGHHITRYKHTWFGSSVSACLRLFSTRESRGVWPVEVYIVAPINSI